MNSHIYSDFHGINCTSRQPQWLSSVSSYYLPLKLKGVLMKNITACFAKFTSYFNIAPCQAKYNGLPNHKFLLLSSSSQFCFSYTHHPSTCSKKNYVRLLRAEFSLILPEVILQEFFVFSLPMFWIGCVLKAADHSFRVDSFWWIQKPGCAVTDLWGSWNNALQ